jgi:predicted acylesterase/phospholipase RssA/CRP-like cAMP-binding protein
MSISILNLVKSSKIFSSLKDADLKKVISRLSRVYLPKQKTLFNQGDLSDGLYLLLSGKLIVLLNTATTEEKVVNEIRPGETVGELGVLSREPRTATVKALANCHLLKLSVADFEELSKEFPSMVSELMSLLVTRSRTMIEMLATKEPTKQHIAILAANTHTSLKDFYEKMVSLASHSKKMIMLSDDDETLNEKYKSELSLQKYIDDMENKKHKIIYFISKPNTHLAKICFDKMDMFYIVGNAGEKPSLSRHLLKIVSEKELCYRARAELILLYDKPDKAPRATSHWLKLNHFGLQHHVRLTENKDCERIFRFIRGEAIGIVMGGGGIRSWAHLGALRALDEAGIPIDIVGGVSGGAIVAGYYALHGTYEDMHKDLDQLSRATSQSVSWRNLTWPAISLFNCEAYTLTLKKIFGKAHIENLWIPYFCVTCNLAKSMQVIHRSGLLWKKIRASTAVPGVFPPVIISGHIHLDGGIVNNLPVDAMKRISSSIGTVIAIELVHSIKDDKDYYFPPVLPFWKTMLAKLGLAYKNYRFPHFAETFLKSLLVGSSVRQKENATMADLLIDPDLSDFNLLSLPPSEEAQLIEIGYMAAEKAIKKWKHKSSVKPGENGQEEDKETVKVK